MKNIVAAIGIAIVLLFVTARVDAQTTIAPSVSPKMLALGKEWFHRFISDRIDHSQLDPLTNAQLTDDLVRRESKRLKAFGPPVKFEYLGSEEIQYATGYSFKILFRSAMVIESIAIDGDGKIAGFNWRTFVRR